VNGKLGRFFGASVALFFLATVSASERGPIQTQAPALDSADSGVFSLSGTAGSGSRITPADVQGRFLYIARFNEPSLARYDGGFAGLAATSARATGQRRLNVNNAASRAYLNFLETRQAEHVQEMQQALQRRLDPTHQWKNVVNGMALRLTPDEAALVESLPFVSAIELDRQDELLSDEGPNLIGAPDFWAGLVTSGTGNKGEGVVIGILDSGFNHAHPSFEEVAADGFIHTNPFDSGVFRGVCANPDADDFEDVCNDKLIGAYSIAAASVTAEDTAASGHGTHVGSTAGGNPVTTEILGQTVLITGVAPRANLINYKVCEPLCSAASRITAVDFALADEVDVLNHSIGNNEPPWASTVSLAFLEANAAGIVVAASAGNSGPGASTAASTGPWNLSVGMSTHARLFASNVTLAGLDAVPGVAGGGPAITETITTDLRWAGDVDTDNILGCEAFPADAFDGQAALISRGSCSFAQKIDNATEAGATFVLVYNSQGGAPTAMGGTEATTIPSLMVSNVAGADFIAALDGGTLEVTIDEEVDRSLNDDFADIMSAGSSRGPASHNTIAPAVTAPGVSILAASTVANENFAFLTGTSMSSPHVAGAAALLVAQHPEWTPTEIRSALTLTANPNHRKEDGLTPADPFDMGSGRIDVAAAGNVGFVMDETSTNFEDANPATGGDPGQLNLSSIKSLRCPEVCSYQRTIKSVLDVEARYIVSFDGELGSNITVTPGSFTLAAGESLTLNIEIDVTEAQRDVWLFGGINVLPADDVMISPARLPVAVVADDQVAALSVTPNALSATQETDDVLVAAEIEIRSAGELPLEWSLVEIGVRGGSELVGPGVLWNNPRSGGSGRINNFALNAGTGIYQTDFFQLLTRSSIETISSEGFILGNPGVTKLVWMVFENAGGVPAGHPETDLDSAIWSFSAAPNDPGVSFQGATMFLDLAAADAPELILDPGFYWLVAYPEVQTYSLGPNNLYAWFHGASGAGRQIGPGELSGFPTDWAGVPEGRAFRLTGSVECAFDDISWLSLSETSGSVSPGQTQTVAVTFDSTELDEGVYLGTLCVTSNARDNAFSLIPVTLTVENLPDGAVDTPILEDDLEFGESGQSTVTLTNTGKGELTFNVVGASAPPDSASSRASELLYGQTASQTTSGINATYDLDDPAIFAVQAADDFTVPAGEVWSIDRVVANGFYFKFVGDNLPVPTDSVRVFVYEDENGQPGLEMASFLGLVPSADNNGSLTIDLPSSVSLAAGTYWLSVQPEMDYFVDGLWYWLTNSAQAGSKFHWRNPGGFYAGGNCTDWRPGDQCGFDNPDLSFQVFGSSSSCDLVDDVPWLSVSPVSGTVAPLGGTQALTFDVDASAVPPGSYSALVCIQTNDDNNPLLSTQVSLDVAFPANTAVIEGEVQTLGYCSAAPALVEGASVVIEGVSEAEATITTAADGSYFAVVDAADSPYTVTASAPDHFPDAESGVAVVGSTSVTVDFGLVLESACATVAPATFADALLPGESGAYELVIGNSDGTVPLVWAIQEASVDEQLRDELACDSPDNVPWLNVAPFFGSTAPGESSTVDVTVNATGLVPGLYEAVVCVNTDDEQASLLPVPFALTVLPDGIFQDRFEGPEDD